MNVELFGGLWEQSAAQYIGWPQCLMLCVSLALIGWSIRKEAEPVLLLPIAFAALLVNIPASTMAQSALESAIQFGDDDLLKNIAALLNMKIDDIANIDTRSIESLYSVAPVSRQQWVDSIVEGAGFKTGFLKLLYDYLLANGLAPLILLLSVGAMTDLSHLYQNPKLLLISLVSQVGVLFSFFGMVYLLGQDLLHISFQQAAVLSMVGSGDGLTGLYAGSVLAPGFLPTIATLVCLYVVLLPLVQPPLMRLMVSREQRSLAMPLEHKATREQKLLFPIVIFLLVALVFPKMAVLLGMFFLGVVLRESSSMSRFIETLQHTLVYVVTLFFGLAVGSQLTASRLFTFEMASLALLVVVACVISTVLGILIAKILGYSSDKPINPLIGAAGISFIPVSSRLVCQEGLRVKDDNSLLLPALAVNAGSVILSVVIASCFMSYFSM